ncbi:hypothetical protein [Streptomyces litmocidini]|nr:hypothetical protein [Streptomyces litmocidini]
MRGRPAALDRLAIALFLERSPVLGELETGPITPSCSTSHWNG